MVDLLRIETFLHAAENLNFSEAARILHLSQPTVSHHIKNMENDLGVTLFERHGASIKLTDAGRLLVPWARRVMRDSIEMQEMMESLKEGMAGNLQIACSTTAGKYVLPQLSARFLAEKWCGRYNCWGSFYGGVFGRCEPMTGCLSQRDMTTLLEGSASPEQATFWRRHLRLHRVRGRRNNVSRESVGYLD